MRVNENEILYPEGDEALARGIGRAVGPREVKLRARPYGQQLDLVRVLRTEEVTIPRTSIFVSFLGRREISALRRARLSAQTRGRIVGVVDPELEAIARQVVDIVVKRDDDYVAVIESKVHDLVMGDQVTAEDGHSVESARAAMAPKPSSDAAEHPAAETPIEAPPSEISGDEVEPAWAALVAPAPPPARLHGPAEYPFLRPPSSRDRLKEEIVERQEELLKRLAYVLDQLEDLRTRMRKLEARAGEELEADEEEVWGAAVEMWSKCSEQAQQLNTRLANLEQQLSVGTRSHE